MTLYTDGNTPATEAEILSTAAAIQSGRRVNRRGGPKPKLDPLLRAAARMRIAAGESISAIANDYDVSPQTIRRLKR